MAPLPLNDFDTVKLLPAPALPPPTDSSATTEFSDNNGNHGNNGHHRKSPRKHRMKMKMMAPMRVRREPKKFMVYPVEEGPMMLMTLNGQNHPSRIRYGQEEGQEVVSKVVIMHNGGGRARGHRLEVIDEHCKCNGYPSTSPRSWKDAEKFEQQQNGGGAAHCDSKLNGFTRPASPLTTATDNKVADPTLTNGSLAEPKLANGSIDEHTLANGCASYKSITTTLSPAISPRKRQRTETVKVPTVALPSGTTKPERLEVRKSKVIMLGESGVGKTSIVFSYKYGPPSTTDTMVPCNPTIGASYTNFDLTVLNNVPVQLQLWDTAGQERFRCMVPMYMRNVSAAVLVYDITNRKSFNEIDRWYNEVLRCSGATSDKQMVVVLVGNKADQHVQREVAEEEGLNKALQLKARFYEITAIDAKAICSMFEAVAEKIVRRCEEVDSAWEADEGLSGGEEEPEAEDAEREAAGRSSSSSSACASPSPVIRLGWQPFRGLIGSWWGNSDQGAEELRKLKDNGSSCCATQ